MGKLHQINPFFLPVLNEGESASASEAQALTDGYAIATKGDKELGDTGNPGLEGFTPNQPFFSSCLE